MTLTVEQVQAALPDCNADHIASHLPQLQLALVSRGIWTPLVEVGLIATVGVETFPHFYPCEEMWPHGQTPEQYFAMYAPPHPVARMLGNRTLEEAVLLRGRGDIQLTGRLNYLLCGEDLGLDLLSNPEKLLDPDISARAAAWFFAKHAHRDAQQHLGRLPQLCEEQDWKAVREGVNGGLNGYPRFERYVMGLLPAAA